MFLECQQPWRTPQPTAPWWSWTSRRGWTSRCSIQAFRRRRSDWRYTTQVKLAASWLAQRGNFYSNFFQKILFDVLKYIFISLYTIFCQNPLSTNRKIFKYKSLYRAILGMTFKSHVRPKGQPTCQSEQRRFYWINPFL